MPSVSPAVPASVPTFRALPQDQVIQGDALEVLRSLPDASVDCICSDPPYYRVKGEAWDRQWDKPAAFLAWLGTIADEWRRVLKPNGSLYVFASPQMAARVEVMLAERFHVLNHIVWSKPAGHWKQAEKEALRGYFPSTERLIFAEHYGADSMALGESGYAAQCEHAHGLVFEPLRAYLDGERRRAGIDKAECNVACGFSRTPGGMASRHYFSTSQWQLPTERHYHALQRLFNAQGRRPAPPFADFHPAGSPFARFHERPELTEYLRADYEDLRADYEDLRADYEDLRADYEDLRRPFTVTADVPYTDVWDFATVPYRPGKHVCEKPVPLLRHALRASTRPGALVLDCFAGSGSTGAAALAEGRHYLLIERDPLWVARARQRLQGFSEPAPAAALTPAKPTRAGRRLAPITPLPMRSLWDVSA